MTIRKAQFSDRHDLVAVWEAAAQLEHPVNEPGKFPPPFWIHLASGTLGPVLVHETNGTIDGFMWYGSNKTHIELFALYVHPNSQRQGIGQKLLAEAEEEPTVLWVMEGNEPAKAFYFSLGWEPTGVKLLKEKFVLLEFRLSFTQTR